MEKKEKKGRKTRVGISFTEKTMQIINSAIENGQYGNRSECVNAKICTPMHSSLDTQILQKLIPAFAKARLKVHLESEEQNRIKELFKQ